jgi:hypothetical protein
MPSVKAIFRRRPLFQGAVKSAFLMHKLKTIDFRFCGGS